VSTYVGRIQRYVVDRAPYWIRNGYGGKFLQALGLTLDTAQATLLHALRQTRPLVAFSDALDYLAADRNIRRYPTEPEESHRMRLARWRQIKRHAGSAYGHMINLQPYFLPGPLPRIRIVHQSDDDGVIGPVSMWHTLDPDGTYSVHAESPSNWNWDDQPEQWSRMWCIIDVSGLSTVGAAQWDDGIADYDDGVTVWDGYLSSAARDDIMSILNEDKGPQAIWWGLILATDPDSFDPTSTAVADVNGATSLPIGNWGSAIDPSTGLPSRLSTAAFAYDVGQGQI
jgi:hypothetical protein